MAIALPTIDTRRSTHFRLADLRMELLLGCQQPLFDHQLDGVGSVIKQERQFLFLCGSKIPEYIIRRIHAAWRTPHANADPIIVFRPESFGHVAQTVVAAFPATDFELEGIEGDVDLVNALLQRGRA